MGKVQTFVVAIPARYASTRLPGKPLQLIGGEPMVLRVARRALAAGAAEVVVATDDDRVAAALAGQPVRVAMTRTDHASGSDRLAECAAQLGWSDDTIVVNLQGDEPLAPPSGIRAVATALAGSDAPMATLRSRSRMRTTCSTRTASRSYATRAGTRSTSAARRCRGPATPLLATVKLCQMAFRFCATSGSMPTGRDSCADSPRCRRRRWSAPNRSSNCGRWSTASA